MIVEVYPFIMEDGSENLGLIKHYSDQNRSLLQNETNIIYNEAIDIYPCPYTYTEIIEEETETEEVE